MKIVMTADAVGGVWAYSLELARALAEHGVEVHLATMGALPTDQQRRDAKRLPNVRLHESQYKLEWMDDPWDDVAAAGRWLLRLQDDVGADLVHLNGFVHASLPWPVSVLVVGHSCVLSWWEAVKREPAPPSCQRYRREVEAGLRSADLVMAPSRAMLDALRRHYGILDRTRVIYNARDPREFAPAKVKEPFVLTAGRIWDEAKNLAAMKAVASDLSWPVYVAGESKHPDGDDAVCCNGLRCLGSLDPQTLAGWMGRASIYALPARYEPFGLSALEAALSGCALVLGDIESLREIWHDAAVFVRPEDAEALRSAIQRLIDDPPRRAELGARALRRAQQYSPPRMARAYVDAYASVLSVKEEAPSCAS